MWIRVTERLPEEGQRVIVTQVSRGYKHVCSDLVRYTGRRFMFVFDDWLSRYDITNEVTHWMPYPEPAED